MWRRRAKKKTSEEIKLERLRDHQVEACRHELAAAQPAHSVAAELTLIEDEDPVGAFAFHSPSAWSQIKPVIEELVEVIRGRAPQFIVLTTPCRWVPESHHSVFLAAIDRQGQISGAILYVARKRFSPAPLIVTVPRSHPGLSPVLRPLQAAMRTISS